MPLLLGAQDEEDKLTVRDDPVPVLAYFHSCDDVPPAAAGRDTVQHRQKGTAEN